MFYLDDIEFVLSPAAKAVRLEEPRFLASFTTLPEQPLSEDCATEPGFDLSMRNMAFSYDNALALLAYLAHGSGDSVRRARLIGDAFRHVATHDRFLTDGSVRSGYAAGDVALPPGWEPNGVEEAASLPGFYCEQPGSFFETAQEAIDVGNNSWVMIALLALFQETGEPSYLGAAEAIGDFIEGQRNDSGTYQGYLGGIDQPEGTAAQRPWASAERNLDIVAAFSVMADLSGEPAWSDGSAHAAAFLEDVWDPGIGCYRAGTLDPETLNTVSGQLSLDVQAWAALALPDVFSSHPELLDCAEAFHHTSDSGFLGFDFNEDTDGVWFEGTAQMATAYLVEENFEAAALFRNELRVAQQTAPFGDGAGLAAATVDGLSTGFGFEYFRRLHIGAGSWNVFAQLFFNPYYQTSLLLFADGFESGNADAWHVIN